MGRRGLSVHEYLNTECHMEVEENPIKVRWKVDEDFVFTDLLHSGVDWGDEILKNHFESGTKYRMILTTN